MAKKRRDPPVTDEPQVWPIVGPHETTLKAMVDGIALMGSMLPPDDTALDNSATENADAMELARLVEVLAKILVAELATVDPTESRARERSDAIEAINVRIRQQRFRASKRRREDALSEAAELISEMGHEYHDLECVLGTTRDGRHVIVADRIPLPAIYVSLIGRLFQRADSLVASDRFLALERAASSWFFLGWVDGTDFGDPAYVEFPRDVREHEWSLVSRDTLALEEPVIASFAGDDADDVPPRQRHLARAYLQSIIGIFEVTAADGRNMTVRNATDGQTYVVREHNEDIELFPGLLIVGRLIPVHDDFWLRSPGAIILKPQPSGFLDALVESLTKMSEQLPTQIALEAVISFALYGGEVPQPVQPAPTVELARAALIEVMEQLDELGLAEDIPQDLLEPTLNQSEDLALGAVRLGVDQVLGEWMAALYSQGGFDEAFGERQRRASTPRKHQRSSKAHRKRRR